VRAPRHYLLLVYLHSSKEKRETQISLTNSLLLVFRSLSFHQKSLFCSSLLQLSFFTIFCEKNANSIKIPLFSVSKTFAKKIRHLNSRGQRRKRREEEPSTDRFFQSDDEEIILSRNSLFKKIIIQTQGVFTHTRVHTHTHTLLSLSLSICKLSEHCCCCCCCELSSVFSSSLSLFLSEKKKRGRD